VNLVKKFVIKRIVRKKLRVGKDSLRRAPKKILGKLSSPVDLLRLRPGPEA
jgi:hypothetical protein